MKHVASVLLVVGLVQMIGDLLGVAALKGIGAAWMISPAPKVFSSVQGLETYSTRFTIEWTDRAGTPQSAELDAERYRGLRGPYNRRNAYGAVVAYGPVLARGPGAALFQAVGRHALCGDAPLLDELGIEDVEPGSVVIRLDPLEGTDLGDLPRRLAAPCGNPSE